MTIENVKEDIKQSQEANYHRGKSWEHCYVFFKRHKGEMKNSKTLKDHAALHIAFFLASWGMLRGSSFLLQKDYKFYVPIVEILVKSDYDKLWDSKWDSSEDIASQIDILFTLKKDLEKTIKEENKKDDDNKKHNTDLIITKIIMATMGCVPAYDQFFKKGIREKWGKGLGSFSGKGTFIKLLEKIKNDKELKTIYSELQPIKEDNRIQYPPMKLLDLYFWLLGVGDGKWKDGEIS